MKTRQDHGPEEMEGGRYQEAFWGTANFYSFIWSHGCIYFVKIQRKTFTMCALFGICFIVW